MAIQFIGQATGTTSATLPAHQAGDLIVAYAFRDAGTGTPSLPAGWTGYNGPSGNGLPNSLSGQCSHRLGYRIATDSNTVSGTWTNATSVVFLVYRNALVGAYADSLTSSGTTIAYPGLSPLTVTDGTSWVAAFCGMRSTNTAAETPPAGMTLRANVLDSTDEASGFDTNGGISSWTAVNVAGGGTASGRGTVVVELVKQSPKMIAERGTFNLTGVNNFGKVNGAKLPDLLESFEATPNTPNGIFTSWTKNGFGTLASSTLNATQGSKTWKLSGSGPTTVLSGYADLSAYDAFAVDVYIETPQIFYYQFSDGTNQYNKQYFGGSGQQTYTVTKAEILAEDPSFNFANMTISLGANTTGGSFVYYLDNLRGLYPPPPKLAANAGSFVASGKSVSLYKTDTNGDVILDDFEKATIDGQLDWTISNGGAGTSVAFTRSSLNATDGNYSYEATFENGSGSSETLLDSFENSFVGGLPSGGLPWIANAHLMGVPLDATYTRVTSGVTEGAYALEATGTLVSGSVYGGIATADFTNFGTPPENQTAWIDLSAFNSIIFDYSYSGGADDLTVLVCNSNGDVLNTWSNAGVSSDTNNTIDLTAMGSYDQSECALFFIVNGNGAYTFRLDNIVGSAGDGAYIFAPSIIGRTLANPQVRDYIAFDLNVTDLPVGGAITVGLIDSTDSAIIGEAAKITSLGSHLVSIDTSTLSNVSNGFKVILTSGLWDGGFWVPTVGGTHKFYIDSLRLTDTVVVNYPIVADKGSFNLTGQDAGFKRTRRLTAAGASFTMTGQPAVLKKGFKLFADPRPFTFTGIDAILKKGRTLTSAKGDFTLTGQPINFVHIYRLAADARAFTLTRQPANLKHSWKLISAGRSFTLNGQQALLKRAKKVIAAVGSFTFTGRPVTLTYGRAPLIAGTGAFNITSYNVVLKKTHYTPVDAFNLGMHFTPPAAAAGASAFPPASELGIEFIIPYFVGERFFTRVSPPTINFALNWPQIDVRAGVNILAPAFKIGIANGIQYYKIQLVTCVGDPDPIQHIADSKKLDADGYVELFEIILANGNSRLLLKQNKNVTWQGRTYEGSGIQIEGVGRYADDQVSRPRLTLFNPNGVFSYLVDQGFLENATIKRTRVLKEHIEADVPVYRVEQWKVSRVASVKRGFIGLELRGMMDGQNFLTPGRMFIPPDFPTVSLS